MSDCRRCHHAEVDHDILLGACEIVGCPCRNFVEDEDAPDFDPAAEDVEELELGEDSR